MPPQPSSNFDAIASVYDRGRSLRPEVLDVWLTTIEQHLDRPIGTILDLGCGTGRFSEALARRVRARVIGVDPSPKMLQQAQLKMQQRAWFIVARGEDVPLEDGSVQLVFISMVFHHFLDPSRV
jgi:ubiquinone/menaquinone biosynthesis C-methylase UbiE